MLKKNLYIKSFDLYEILIGLLINTIILYLKNCLFVTSKVVKLICLLIFHGNSFRTHYIRTQVLGANHLLITI